MGTSSVDDTAGSVFSAVRVSSMRLADKWVCDSGASHHLIANKQYFVTYKRFSAPDNISLKYHWKIKERYCLVDLVMLILRCW